MGISILPVGAELISMKRNKSDGPDVLLCLNRLSFDKCFSIYCDTKTRVNFVGDENVDSGLIQSNEKFELRSISEAIRERNLVVGVLTEGLLEEANGLLEFTERLLCETPFTASALIRSHPLVHREVERFVLNASAKGMRISHDQGTIDQFFSKVSLVFYSGTSAIITFRLNQNIPIFINFSSVGDVDIFSDVLDRSKLNNDVRELEAEILKLIQDWPAKTIGYKAAKDRVTVTLCEEKFAIERNRL